MHLRYAILTGYLGRQADRFTEYQPNRTLEERFAMAAQIEGVEGMEVRYPADFVDDESKPTRLLKQYGFACSAVNLDVKRDVKWRYGSFTAENPAIRRAAVEDTKRAMDIAADLGCHMVTCCPLIDGHDYIFQIDYALAWQRMIDGIGEAAAYRPDVKISLEYKASETKVRTILPDVGRALHLCDQVGLPNVGVTLDFGHALQAGETPAESVCLLARVGRLFYLHTNDNPRTWDWDMISGSVNPWDYLEFLYYLDKYDYRGWIAADICPKQVSPVEIFSADVRSVRRMEGLLHRLDRQQMELLIRGGNPALTFDALGQLLDGGIPQETTR